MSRHVIFAAIFTPRVVGQRADARRSTPGRSAVGQRSVSGQSAVGHPMTARRRSVFYEKYRILFSFRLPVCNTYPIYIYIICIPTHNCNNKFLLQFILRDKKMANLEC